MNKTNEILKVSKQLEILFDQGFFLLFPADKKGVCTVMNVKPDSPKDFAQLITFFKLVMDKGSNYKWEKDLSEFKTKEKDAT